MSNFTLDLTPEVYEYYLNHALREHPVLTELREATQQLTTARMQISPEQGQFMQLLMELMGAKKTLDIGTYTGYSALAVALALPNAGQVIACDISNKFIAFATPYWEKAGMGAKITP